MQNEEPAGGPKLTARFRLKTADAELADMVSSSTFGGQSNVYRKTISARLFVDVYNAFLSSIPPFLRGGHELRSNAGARRPWLWEKDPRLSSGVDGAAHPPITLLAGVSLGQSCTAHGKATSEPIE